MKLRNCQRCGKLFSYNGIHKICPACREEEENNFKKVKDYLWENPKSTIDKVSKETGVERDTIIKFIKEDRLISEGLEIGGEVKCERCGTTITHGTLCDKCRKELVDGFTPVSNNKKSKKQRSNKKDDMYIKNRIKNRKKK